LTSYFNNNLTFNLQYKAGRINQQKLKRGLGMKYNRTFSHTQVGFIGVLAEPVHVQSGMEYVKEMFLNNPDLPAVPIEGDIGVIGFVERDEFMKKHGMIDNLLHNNLEHYVEQKTVSVDAREHVERILPLLVKSGNRIVENCMIYHLGKYYGVLNTHVLLNHIFNLRDGALKRAQSIQTYFTGENDYTHGNFNAHVYLEQAHALGGDFFQMTHLSDEISVVSCFDVSGKDIQASLMTGFISGYIAGFKKHIDKENINPSNIVLNLHEIVKDYTPDDIFVAGVMVFYNSDKKEITIFNMGYSPIYMITKTENKWKIKKRNPGLPPLGFPSFIIEDNSSVTLHQDKNLILFGYSDGLTDAHDSHGNEYGEQRITDNVQKLLAAGTREIARRMLEDVKDFVGTSPRTDDCTVFQINFEE
jgi:serine phosphatase RsbU (regulator of sigma subunit)